MILPVGRTALIVVAVTIPQGTTLTTLTGAVRPAIITRHTLQPHTAIHKILSYGDKLTRRSDRPTTLEHLFFL